MESDLAKIVGMLVVLQEMISGPMEYLRSGG